jgi:E2F/DP family winged-helix DNA-binding domain
MKKEFSTKDTSKKLIRISSLIIPIIKERNSVTQESIIQELIEKKHIDISEKLNTQRRVYDAVNVFAALGIIQKTRKCLTYKQHPQFNIHDAAAFDNSKILEEKKEKLNALCNDFLLKTYQIMKNKQQPSTLKLYMPFNIFKLEKFTDITTVRSNSEYKLLIKTKNRPSLIMPHKLIQKMCAKLSGQDIYRLLPPKVYDYVNSKKGKEPIKYKEKGTDKEKEKEKEREREKEKEKEKEKERNLPSSIKRDSPERIHELPKSISTPKTMKNNLETNDDALSLLGTSGYLTLTKRSIAEDLW